MDNIIIVMMDGGLGNQIGQAVFIKFLEKVYGTKCLVDDSAFWSAAGEVDHNGFELDKVFNLQFPFLSEIFDEAEWINMLIEKKKGTSIPQQLLDKGFPLSVISEGKASRNFFSGELLSLPEEITDIPDFLAGLKGNLYFYGYYINSIYWKILSGDVRKEFKFHSVDLLEETNLEYIKKIQEYNSVAVHIRRGDFISVGRDIGPDKYNDIISKIKEKDLNSTFFVFSDDIEWCKNNRRELGLPLEQTIFVEGNSSKGCQYKDMYLMSLCKQIILCDSSFSFWAAMFNEYPGLKLYRVYREKGHNKFMSTSYDSDEKLKMFSIIIPCYNVEKYISECLESLVNQTIDHSLLEIILVDDCSTDGTVGILKDYEKRYPELFILILLDRNGKQGRARNIGMQYATGKYLSFVDSDDFIRTDMYEILEKIVSEYNTDVVQFRYQIFRNGLYPTWNSEDIESIIHSDELKIYLYSEERKKYLLNNSILNESCSQKIYRRELIQQAGLAYMEGGGYEEPLFTYPIKFLVDKIAVLEKNLYFYRENQAGTTMKYMNSPETILDHIGTQLELRKFIEKMSEAEPFNFETELYFVHAFYVEPFYFMRRRGWGMAVGLWKYLKMELLNHAPNCIDNPYLNNKSLEEERKLVELIMLPEKSDEEMQKILDEVMQRLIF